MSATINWERVNPNPKHLKKVGGPSRFIDAMERAGYSLPCTLDDSCIPKLEGMAALDGEHSPYEELIDLINEHGPIRLWATY